MLIAEASDGILMDMTAKESCIDLSSVGLTWWVIVPLASGLVCVARRMLTETLTIAAVIALGAVVVVLYAADVWVVARIDVRLGTVIGLVTGISVDVFARVVANSCAATIAALSISTLTSAESLLCD